MEPLLRQETEARQASEAKAEALAQSSKTLQARLNQASAERERLEREYIAMRNTQETLQHQIRDQEAAAVELRESLTRTAAQVEQENAQRAQADEQARSSLAAETDRLKARLQAVETEKAELQAKLNVRQAAESKASVQTTHAAESSLQRRMEEMEAYELVTGELNRVRHQLADERSQRQRMQAEVGELEDTKADMAKKLETLTQSDRLRQQTIDSMETRLQETLTKLSAVEASLQTQSRESRRTALRARELEEQLGDLTSQVTTQSAIEQSRRRREAELEACIVEQQAQIANAKAAVAAEGVSMQRTRERIHFALCRVIQELNTDKASLAPVDRSSQNGTVSPAPNSGDQGQPAAE